MVVSVVKKEQLWVVTWRGEKEAVLRGYYIFPVKSRIFPRLESGNIEPL